MRILSENVTYKGNLPSYVEIVFIIFFYHRKNCKRRLTNQDLWMLAVTSGTTGKSCLIPKTRDNSKAFVEYGFAMGVYYTLFNVLQVSGNLNKQCKRGENIATRDGKHERLYL